MLIYAPQDGTWNDYPVVDSHIEGYVVEWGPFNDDFCVPTNTATAMASLMVQDQSDLGVVANPDDLGLRCFGSPIIIDAADLLANDDFPEESSYLISEIALVDPEQGSVVDNGDETYTFTPEGGITSPVNLTYDLMLVSSDQTFSGNGHFYEYVAEPLSWTEAKKAAATRTWNGPNGISGYDYHPSRK